MNPVTILRSSRGIPPGMSKATEQDQNPIGGVHQPEIPRKGSRDLIESEKNLFPYPVVCQRRAMHLRTLAELPGEDQIQKYKRSGSKIHRFCIALYGL